jgi:hypothetical protein
MATLKVFELSKHNVADYTMVPELAINNELVISGSYYNRDSDGGPVNGMVDRKSQLALGRLTTAGIQI